jgi:pimeloyl-ACP methyl ester carboxylesterase
MARASLVGRKLDVHYEVRGEGSPLLLLMGWRASLDWWPEPLLAALERRHRLILLDNRGVGRTGDPGGFYSMGQMADDAVALLDDLGVAEADVFGVSMGGMIAQEVALRHRRRVRRLVLAGTHCGRRARVGSTPAMRRAWVRALRAPWRVEENLLYLLFSADRGAIDPQALAELERVVARSPATPWASAKQWLAIMRHDTYARLPSISAPTLVVTGEDDLMVAPGNSEVLARRIPGARLVTFPATGHALLRSRAAELDALLRDFLA